MKEKKSRNRIGLTAEATEGILKTQSDKWTDTFSYRDLLPYISFDIPAI